MKFKFLTWAMMLGMLSFGAVACDDDDDDEPNGDNKPSVDDVQNDTTTYMGQMNVVFMGQGNLSDSTVIKSSYDSLGNLNLEFIQVRFVPQMPVKIDITVPSIPCNKENGVVAFQGDSIVPTVKGVPFAQYTAGDLKGEVKGDSIAFSLKFGSFPTSYKGAVVK